MRGRQQGREQGVPGCSTPSTFAPPLSLYGLILAIVFAVHLLPCSASASVNWLAWVPCLAQQVARTVEMHCGSGMRTGAACSCPSAPPLPNLNCPPALSL